MIINIAICDDDKLDLHKLSTFIKEYATLNHIAINIDAFSSASDLIQSSKVYDCYFLDVVLDDDFSGIDITKKLKLNDSDAKVIIVSSNIIYAKDAVNIHADYYILKPIEMQEINNALDNVLSVYSVASVNVYDSNNISRKILFAKITSIETYKRITLVSLIDNKKIIVKKTISQWIEILNGDTYAKCYRGLIVNVKQIREIIDNEIHMKDGRVLYASRACIDNVTHKFYMHLDRITV